MSNDMTFDKLDYFLRCYYVQTFNFDELDKLTYDFRYYESAKHYNTFLKEINFIKLTKRWNVVKTIFKKNGYRDDDDIIEDIVTIIYKALTDNTWNKETYKPFS